MAYSQVYTMDGLIEDLDGEYINGNVFFRKMSKDITELTIAKIIMDNPHPNIVTIYRVGSNYFDMELLDSYDNDGNLSGLKDIQDSMYKAKTYLQSLGIMYIDWKLDNTGIGKDGSRKLFDFDASGIIDLNTQKWINKPPEYVSYINSKNKGLENPYDIDNFSFEVGFHP
jgi:hypothetical protein